MSNNTGNNDFDVVAPDPSALIESLRAFGYDLGTAIGDLIDNSITAGANIVWINFIWNGEDSYINITDNGHGMSDDQLKNAMKPGSKNPLDDRDPSDLGRFGLGLKTASFSQCRRLTVASKTKDTPISIRRWDLDFIRENNNWFLLKMAYPSSEKRLEKLNTLANGTVVLWENLDRLLGKVAKDDDMAQKRFLRIATRSGAHLAMTFHRFLSGEKPRLKIYINGNDHEHLLEPWDPFLETHPATIPYPDDCIQYAGSVIKIKGFVLPHKDRLGVEVHQLASGLEGWNAQQGFYVYRNERLIVAGDWLGLGATEPWKKEEHYKLARIRVDIPNSMDKEWQIDVRKSTAKPPAAVSRRMYDLAFKVRQQAREVFAHRGLHTFRSRTKKIDRIWLPCTRNGSQYYKIDRNYPLVKEAMDGDDSHAEKVETLLRVIEETLPAHQIWLDTADQHDIQSSPFDGADATEILRMIERIFLYLCDKEHLSEIEAIRYISTSAEFAKQNSIIQIVAERNNVEYQP